MLVNTVRAKKELNIEAIIFCKKYDAMVSIGSVSRKKDAPLRVFHLPNYCFILVK